MSCHQERPAEQVLARGRSKIEGTSCLPGVTLLIRFLTALSLLFGCNTGF